MVLRIRDYATRVTYATDRHVVDSTARNRSNAQKRHVMKFPAGYARVDFLSLEQHYIDGHILRSARVVKFLALSVGHCFVRIRAARSNFLTRFSL